MAAFDFPSSPSNGQTYAPTGGPTYTYSSAIGAWLASSNAIAGGIEVVIDGGGAVITTGVKGDVQIPFAGTIAAVTLLADVSGSIVIDIWKDSYANYPPVV